MRYEVNGIGIEVHDEGSGPPVLLLHGWPDSHRLWRHQVAALTAAGYRCVVPDLRGFGESDRPAEVEAYALPILAGDVLGVLDHLGIDRAHVVGHDWGAALAWVVAGFAPDRVDHLVAMSVGHLSSFREAGWAQREKSWYMLLFQFEGVAEQWLSDDDFANLRAWSGHPDADAVIADLVATRCDHGEPQLVPGEHPAEQPRRSGDRAAARRRADDGDLEQRRLRLAGGADDRLGGPRQGSVALRARRGGRALDAARATGDRERPPARLPPGAVTVVFASGLRDGGRCQPPTGRRLARNTIDADGSSLKKPGCVATTRN